MIDKDMSAAFRDALDNMDDSHTVGFPVEQFTHSTQDILDSINRLLAFGAARLVDNHGTAYIVLTDLAAEAMTSYLTEKN